MLRIGTKAKSNATEVIRKAVQFFGPGGYGLEIKDQNPTYIRFQGGGGGVEVTACVDGEGSDVEMVSQEWDGQAKEFIQQISR